MAGCGSASYCRWLRVAISRAQRILGKQRKDIRQHQLLVLLLVMDAGFDQRKGFMRQSLLQEPPQMLVDMAAIGPHLFNRGPREQTALRSRMPGAKALVIGIETIGKALVETFVTAQKALQHQLFEKPCCVGEMPLGWACVLVGLDNLILHRKRLGDIEREAPCCEKGGRELKLPILLGAGGAVVEWHKCLALL